MAGPFDDLVGELSPGQTGWLPLDEAGYPTGPAVIIPPPPPALGCAVTVNPHVPLPEGEHLLLSKTGAELKPPLVSNIDNRDDDWVAPTQPEVPSIISLTPSTAECGSLDVEMIIEGAGFTPSSVITFNGLDEPIVFYSPTSISTVVKPSLFIVPAICMVAVRDAAGTSNELPFDFTAPVVEGRRK